MFNSLNFLSLSDGFAQLDLESVKREEGYSLSAFVTVVAGGTEGFVDGGDLFIRRFSRFQERFHNSSLPTPPHS